MSNPTIHVEVKPSPIHGRGVFATKDFITGELIGMYDGRIVYEFGDPHTLTLEDDEGRYYGILGDGPLSFMNHSEEPNATIATGGPYVYSVRPIRQGEEILIYYGDDWKPEKD